MPKLKTAAAIATCLVLSCGAAAAQAWTASDLNMRAGPGTNHAVIDVIPQGASVEVYGCERGWCEVDYAGTTGFASQNFLEMDGGTTGQAGGEFMGEELDELGAEGPAWDEEPMRAPGW